MANQHVVPKNGKWQVKRENSARATKNFATQNDARLYARSIAEHQHSEVVIHDRKGRIRNKNSYGNDPWPPKDNRH